MNIDEVDNFAIDQRSFVLNFELLFLNEYLSEDLVVTMDEFAILIASRVRFNLNGIQITPLDLVIQKGSIIITVITIVTAAIGTTANYKSLRESIPTLIQDVANVAERVMKLVKPTDDSKDDSGKQPNLQTGSSQGKQLPAKMKHPGPH